MIAVDVFYDIFSRPILVVDLFHDLGSVRDVKAIEVIDVFDFDAVLVAANLRGKLRSQLKCDRHAAFGNQAEYRRIAVGPGVIEAENVLVVGNCRLNVGRGKDRSGADHGREYTRRLWMSMEYG